MWESRLSRMRITPLSLPQSTFTAMRGALPQPMPMPVPAAVVANAFVQQYFTTRHANPSQIFRFYGARPTLAVVSRIALAVTSRVALVSPGANSVAAWPSRFTPWPEAGAPVDGAAPAPLLELNAGLQAIDVKARDRSCRPGRGVAAVAGWARRRQPWFLTFS